VTPLKNKADLSMHGVVLQIRVFRPARDVSRETFTRKRGLPSQARTACDVSRETIFSSAAHPHRPRRCFT
ncbi:MAG: hypothetical protein ACREE7_04875, partial [Dongiaceae bacterium]